MENFEPKFHSTALSLNESLKPKRIYSSSKKPISRDSERYFIPGYFPREKKHILLEV